MLGNVRNRHTKCMDPYGSSSGASIDRVGDRARRSMDGAKEDGDGNDVVTRIQSEVSAQ